jgi:hypothetical protein
VKNAPVIRRVPRRWAALVLLAMWSMSGIWGLSHAAEHAFEHADSEQHATLDDECQAASEVSLTSGGLRHRHLDDNSVVATAKPRFESGAALTSAPQRSSPPLLASSTHPDQEVLARASPDASGSSGPRAPPLS